MICEVMDVSMWHEKLKLMLLRSQISASYRIPTDQHWFDATKDKIVMWFIISLTVELTVIKLKSKYFSEHTFRQFSCSWNTRDFFLVCSTLPRTHCKILWLSLQPLFIRVENIEMQEARINLNTSCPVNVIR